MVTEREREKLRRKLGRDPSYEDANLPNLSPSRSEAQNSLRAARAQQPIPPPERDLYVAKPSIAAIKPVDTSELEAEIRAAQAQMGMMDRVLGRGAEGFRDAERHGLLNGQQPEFPQYLSEGFTRR